ncbi:MAG: hypothetical protein GY811_25645 [Myxococcales bacterium]|nr:hypothetical protein [Myxococcales bacterium]
MGTIGGPLLGEISDTLLMEVTIDPDTLVAIPVENGESWCINAHLFDLVIE